VREASLIGRGCGLAVPSNAARHGLIEANLVRALELIRHRPAPTLLMRMSALISDHAARRGARSIAGARTMHPAVAQYAKRIGTGSLRTLTQSLEALGSLDVAPAKAARRMGIKWELLREKDFEAIRDAAAARFAPSTANKMLSLLRGVLRACRDLGLMSATDCEAAVRVPNVSASWQPPTINLLTAKDVSHLFESCSTRSGPAGRRDAALLAILLSSGLRRSEAAMLNIGDVRDAGKTLRIRSSKDAGEHRDAQLRAASRRYIADWLQAILKGDDLDACKASATPLLLAVNKGCGIQSRRVTDQAIYNMIRSIGIEAGLPQLTSRSLRLTYVVNLIAHGLPLDRVQERVGHASWVTTGAYRELAEQAGREGFEPFEIPYVRAPKGRGGRAGSLSHETQSEDVS
jgi:site-specific recombinase XerD